MASSRLLEEYQIKLDRYALLAAITERQFLDGWRPVAPLVLPVVLTTHGEFCPGDRVAGVAGGEVPPPPPP